MNRYQCRRRSLEGEPVEHAGLNRRLPVLNELNEPAQLATENLPHDPAVFGLELERGRKPFILAHIRHPHLDGPTLLDAQ